MGFIQKSRILIDSGYFYNESLLIYEDYDYRVEVPKQTMSDGPTLNWFTKLFFSTKEYRLGVEAAIVHDHMCNNKHLYSRRMSSRFLRDIWIAAGLNPIKGWLVFIFTDLYQWWEFRDHWKS